MKLVDENQTDCIFHLHEIIVFSFVDWNSNGLREIELRIVAIIHRFIFAIKNCNNS